MAEAELKQVIETRAKFYDAARGMFPNTGDPGAVWVLTQVLGWDYKDVANVSIDGFSESSYRVLVRDKDGVIVKKDYPDGTLRPMVVTREWTKAEKSKLKDWWWLLGF